MTFEHGEDITSLLSGNQGTVIISGSGTKPAETQPAPEPTAGDEPQGDHPIILLIDLAVSLTGTFAESAGIQKPNEKLYQEIAREATNETLWKVAPNIGEGESDSPVLLGITAAVSLGIVFLPTAAGAFKQYKEKQRREQEEAAEELPPYQPAEVPPMPAHLPIMEQIKTEEAAPFVDENDPAYRISQLPENPEAAGISGL